MSTSTGTLEQLSELIGTALAPLALVGSGREGMAEGVVASLGWTLPDGVPEAITDLAESANQVVAAVAACSVLAAEVENEEDSSADLLVATAQVVTAVTALVESLNDLKSKLDSQLPSDFIATTNFPEEFARRVFDAGLIAVVNERFPIVKEALAFLGAIEEEDHDADDASYQSEHTRRTINWDRLGTALTAPQQLLADRFGWGTNTIDEDLLLDGIQGIACHLGGAASADFVSDTMLAAVAPAASVDDGTPRHIRFPLVASDLGGIFLGVMVVPASSSSATAGVALTLEVEGMDHATYELGSLLTLDIESTFDLSAGVAVVLRPDANLEVRTGVSTDVGGAIPEGDARVALTIAQPDEPMTLLSIPDVGSLEINAIEVALTAKARTNGSDCSIEVDFQDGRLEVQTDDGFLAELLPEGLGVDFDFSVGWSASNGVYFGGSASMEVQIPVHVSLFDIVEVDSITLSIATADDAVDVTAAGSFSATLGPLFAAVDQLGLTAHLTFVGSGGDLGPLDAEFSIKPPSGVGLSIDGQGFSGGGYLSFDVDKGEYAGALELSFNAIALKAIGLLNTRMPDGSSGYSLLIIITAEFTPIQLGMGFTLNGVGGLLGLHRTMKVDELREGVKTGALSSILFPTDVVDNVDRILSDVAAIFPVERDQFVFGPMAKLGWGTPSLITAELGLLIEIASPTQIAIVGVMAIALPTKDEAIVKLQVNFLGTIDFEQGLIAFDASLYDSKILTFTLHGDMALRLAWGDGANFLMSIGGFHPSYEPPPLALPSLERLSIHLLSGNPSLTVSAYFAVTSNTVQFGSSINLVASESGFSLTGRLSFDALFQFSPFYFVVSIEGSVALKAGDTTLFSVTVQLSLEGPTPWRADGSASFKVLGVKASVSFSKTWGENQDTSLPDIAVMPLLADALATGGNWSAELPADAERLVTLTSIEEAIDSVVVDPAGKLRVSQKIVPLGLSIDVFGNQSPSDAHAFEISTVTSGTTSLETDSVDEQFAPAQFFEMTNSEKLSRNSFEEMAAGVTIAAGGELQSSHVVTQAVEYETVLIDRSAGRLALGTIGLSIERFDTLVRGAAVARSTLSATRRSSAFSTPAVLARSEGFGIVSVDTLQLHAADFVWSSETEARAALTKIVDENPALADSLQVVPDYEIAA